MREHRHAPDVGVAQGELNEHDESHAHGGRGTTTKRLAIVLALISAYLVAELVGGLLANSLALLADAGHMLSDAAALALALFAGWVARRPPTPRRSYGYYRAEILAALINGATLVAIAILILVEAWHRLESPPAVRGELVIAIACGGLVINLIALRILNSGKNESLNLRGAWLHVLTDALGSVGAIIGGLSVWMFGWFWADPAVSVLIALLVVYSSWALLRETVAVLMEGAPGGIDVDAIRNVIASVPGVLSVHDLHVWSITSGMIALSAHACVAGDVSQPEILTALRELLREQFRIDHVTIEIEPLERQHGTMHK